MAEDELKAHAQRIADDILSRVDFCEVYEDEELEDASEEDLQAIHDLILRFSVDIEDTE